MKWQSPSKFSVVLIVLALASFFDSCGGGGGGGGAVTPPGGSGTQTNTGPGFSVSLQQGTYWEYFWTIESTSSAAGSGTTFDTASGRFKVTLGPPVTIQGSQAYPLIITGQTGTVGTDFKPRWTHIAYSSAVLHGSTDGSTLQTILDATKTSMTGGGFIVQFDASEVIGINSGTFAGNYNQLSSNVLSHSTSQGGCETILGNTICGDAQTTFSEAEYHKDGVGPIGIKRTMGYSSIGGGFYSTHQITHVVELVATSLTPADNAIFKQPPWNEIAPLNTPRSNHMAAVYNNKIYVFGGFTSASTPTTSVEIYDPNTNVWSSGPSMPATMTGAVAKTVGGNIYLIPPSIQTIRIFNPVSNTWSTGAASPFDDPSYDGDVWAAPSGGLTPAGNYIVTVTPDLLSGMLRIAGYQTGGNLWLNGTSLTPYTDHRGGAVTVVGNNLYVVGGYRQNLSPSVVYGNTLRYDLSTDTWYQGVGALNVARYDAKAVTLNGEAVVLGGEDVVKELRDVEAYSETSKSWRKLASMLKARSHFSAVVMNGNIYAIGGKSGSNTLGSVEKYTPN